MSPTQRTLKLLREEGYRAEVVEKWNRFSKTRKDLFGVIDIVAIGNGKILGVQATSASNLSARVKKSQTEPLLAEWLKCGGAFECWGWGKSKKKIRQKWSVRRIVFPCVSSPSSVIVPATEIE